jgi:AcrR family transcriptional regulator
MARPVESERKDIRVPVLKKSRELFITEGYKNITMRKIADEIGCAPGSIYLYFKNKEEILYELHNEGFKLLYQYKTKMLDTGVSNALDRLTKGGKTYISFALENPEYYEVMFNMPEPRNFMARLSEDSLGKGLDSEHSVYYALRVYEFLRQGIRECMDEGYLDGVEIDVAAFSFWSTVHGVASLAIRKRGPFSSKPNPQIADSAIDLFMNMVKAQKSNP